MRDRIPERDRCVTFFESAKKLPRSSVTKGSIPSDGFQQFDGRHRILLVDLFQRGVAGAGPSLRSESFSPNHLDDLGRGLNEVHLGPEVFQQG